MGRIVVALSGGLASAWCAEWAVKKFPKDEIILYFNDTKWEHPDLYRFIKDISSYLGKEVYEDSLGLSPEDLFYAHHAIANNRMPFCSHQLKAKRLQNFYRDEDMLVFGIGPNETHRAFRIVSRYQVLAAKTGKSPVLAFPLLDTQVELKKWSESVGVEIPTLYKYGFEHNNCSGGCVRAGKKQWVKLYYDLPEVYAERERVEREVSLHFQRRMTILKDESLAKLRHRIETGNLSRHYAEVIPSYVECFGVCNT